jgi:hypothetical protein
VQQLPGKHVLLDVHLTLNMLTSHPYRTAVMHQIMYHYTSALTEVGVAVVPTTPVVRKRLSTRIIAVIGVANTTSLTSSISNSTSTSTQTTTALSNSATGGPSPTPPKFAHDIQSGISRGAKAHITIRVVLLVIVAGWRG